jgi:hypothetical protein
MLYWIFYIAMLIGYAGVSLQNPDIKTRTIGILLVIVNALLFWK